MRRGKGGAFTDKGAKLLHLGHHHGDDLKRIKLIGRVFPLVLGLDHQNAEVLSQTLDRNTKKRRIHFFARLRHKPKPLGRRGIRGVHWIACTGDPSNKTLANSQARLMNGLAVQTLGSAKFKRIGIPE